MDNNTHFNHSFSSASIICAFFTIPLLLFLGIAYSEFNTCCFRHRNSTEGNITHITLRPSISYYQKLQNIDFK